MNASAPLPPPANPKLRRMANAIRALAMDGVEKAKSGHPGMPMGMADAATVLFTQFLKFDPAAPNWPDRDRFVLSAGHGSMLLYSLLHLTGYPDMTMDQLENFRQLGSKTAGHPERGLATGIEVTTGPLGQGIANAVGIALAERLLAAQFGDVVDHHTYVIAGDGCLMEGISHEAMGLAGHLKLNKLIVLWDNNSITIDGPTSLSVNDDQVERFKAHGWATQSVDGLNHDEVAAAIKQAQSSDKPSLIACKTTIAFGAPTKAGTAGAHGSPLGAEEIKGARERLGWEYPPFVIPDDIRAEWKAAGDRGKSVRASWEQKLNALAADKKAEFTRRMKGELPADFDALIDKACAEFRAKNAKLATRQSSGAVLDILVARVPEMIGGSADLTPSNNTKAKDMADVKPEDGYVGRYMRYGIREHGMAAAMNGMLAHGGIIPYGGTFMCFTDYCRPSIRLSALSELGVIYIMTHDSIGLGEDGPTHQPVEHLAALRAIPHLLVFRPADSIETAECWSLAMKHRIEPSILALTRQGLPLLRTDPSGGNKSAFGAYVLAEAEGGERQVTLLATGSEVEIAMNAREALAKSGVRAAVVSMPCWELFEKQPADYRKSVLGSAPRVGVEAAIRLGWDRWLGEHSAFVGMDGFGASAPIEALYPHFGITAEKVAEAARSLL